MPIPENTDFLVNQDILVEGSDVAQFVYHFLSNSVAVAAR